MSDDGNVPFEMVTWLCACLMHHATAHQAAADMLACMMHLQVSMKCV